MNIMKIKITINSAKLKIMLLFSVILIPELFTQIKIISYSFVCIQLFIFFYFGLKTFVTKNIRREYIIWIAILLYELSIMVINFHFNDIDKLLRLLILVLDSMMVFNYYIQNNKAKEVISALSILGVLYFGINTFMIVFFPNGIAVKPYLHYYFLGLRTDFLKYFFPFFVFTGLNYIYNKKIIYIVALIALALFDFFTFDVSTSITAIIVLCALFILRYSLKNKLTMKNIIIVVTAFTVLIVFFDALHYFNWFVEGVLNREITLSNRVYIWEKAANLILSSSTGFIFGHGIVNDGAFVLFGLYSGGTYWPAHNQLLQWLFEYGLVGTISTFLLFIYLDWNNDNGNDCYFCRAVFCTMLVTGITSSPFGNHLGYVGLCILPFLKIIREQVGKR